MNTKNVKNSKKKTSACVWPWPSPALASGKYVPLLCVLRANWVGQSQWRSVRLVYKVTHKLLTGLSTPCVYVWQTSLEARRRQCAGTRMAGFLVPQRWFSMASLTLEAQACNEAVALATDLHVHSICIASDCAEVVLNISSEALYQYAAILREINHCRGSFQALKFIHEKREYNGEAHSLAKVASSIPFERHVPCVALCFAQHYLCHHECLNFNKGCSFLEEKKSLEATRQRDN